MQPNLSHLGAALLNGLLILPWALPNLQGACDSSFDAVPAATPGGTVNESPTALAADENRNLLYVACAGRTHVQVLDLAKRTAITRLEAASSPSGLALSPDGARLYVTCSGPESTICIIDTVKGQLITRLPAGHTALAPVLSPDESRLYVCNRFDNDVLVVDLKENRTLSRIKVEREPIAAGITPDGSLLLVANHLHHGRANTVSASAAVSVIDTQTSTVLKNIRLAEGSSLLRGIAISPDGKFAAVTHLRSLFWLSTTSVELGRMNANAVSFLDIKEKKVLGTLFLDQTSRGAANPWAVAWVRDGRTVVVSHAGTHELSLIDAPVDADRRNFFCSTWGEYAEMQSEAPDSPKHPVRVRERVALPGEGPRAIVVAGARVYTGNFFSDDLCEINLEQGNLAPERLSLGDASACSLVRKGEEYFNDARLCAQGWQSCASCHDVDARMDAFNWDLLNDGAGNPKNTKSLLRSHDTAPAMSLGVRADAETAVRAGIHHILFSEQLRDVPEAIDAYLKSLRPIPSPHLVNSRLSKAAERGKQIFQSDKTGCVRCHPAPLFTDLELHHVGTAAPARAIWDANTPDEPQARFDTPSLLELWRTAPYLHDGSAATLPEVFTKKNPQDLHGKTAQLGPQEIADLVEYLLTL